MMRSLLGAALHAPCRSHAFGEVHLAAHRGGVRSVGEVFTHITAANCGIAGARGTAPPAGIDLQAITGLFADKPKVLQAMKDSFGHFRNAIVAFNDADADKPQKMFNRQTTLRGSFHMITG